MSPNEFVKIYKTGKLNEQQTAQSHFNDLCRLLGQKTPLEADPHGQFYSFEKRVAKSNGRTGRADVWFKGHFAWEYKGPGISLEKAYEQLQLYRESLENPPLLVVSDILTIEVHSNFNNMKPQIYRFELDDLLDPKKLDQLRQVWVNPDAFKGGETIEEVTKEAAEDFATLAGLMRRQGIEPERAARFSIRLLFCLFAEDIGLLPNQTFTRMVDSTFMRTLRFSQRLRELFGKMHTGGDFGNDEIPRFNGGLFNDDEIVELDADGLDVLHRICHKDWSAIDPAILGTLFERSLDPAKRRQLGAHYTSRDDILLIVEPVLMQPLRRRWNEVRQQAQELATRLPIKTSDQTKIDRLLFGFVDELSQVRVLDPACGSGNFLYVALKSLLDLQKEVIMTASQIASSSFLPSVSVSPLQLRGIEKDTYAHELAQATVWIGYIQWLRENGFGNPSEPILPSTDNILQMDAVLAYDDNDQPVEPVWPDADYIIGNPPFLGGNKVRQELGNQYVDNLFKLYEGRVPAFADFVTYWFERARAGIEAGQIKRAGLLATNSIRGGVNRRVLERIKQSGDIFMAWADRPWVLDGAAVRVSMVGFDNGQETDHNLDGQLVVAINANLTGAADLSQAKRLKENFDIGFVGSQKAGAFDITAKLAAEMLADKGNPNGRPNSDVVKPSLNGSDITGRPRNTWIIDFGTNLSEEEAAQYEKPFDYVKKFVYPVRVNNHRQAYAERWWIHAEARPGMRTAIKNLKRFIGTPRTSKYRVFNWVQLPTLPDHAVAVFAREDDYFFGVLHSRLHEVWALKLGTELEDRPRYTPTSTFETFPFPWPPGHEPQGDARVEAIALAARELVGKRDNWLNPPDLTDEAELKKRTLTNLYNQRPSWLAMAHAKLDRAVLDAYGWPNDLSDEQILERLLELNQQRGMRDEG